MCTIGSIDCGFRVAEGIQANPLRWQSVGVSQAATITVQDFGHSEQDVNITVLVSESVKNSLQTYCMSTIKPWGTISVTPDAGDDLQVGGTAGAAVSLIFISFQAVYIAYGQYQVNLVFRKYT